jgi:hypothetical protein
MFGTQRPREAARRRGQEEAVALARLEPVGERGEVPDLAELEEAMRVQGQRGAMVLVARARGRGLDRVVVGDERDEAAPIENLRDS